MDIIEIWATALKIWESEDKIPKSVKDSFTLGRVQLFLNKKRLLYSSNHDFVFLEYFVDFNATSTQKQSFNDPVAEVNKQIHFGESAPAKELSVNEH
jgi:hypothetical protein